MKQEQRNYVSVHDLDLEVMQIMELDATEASLGIWPVLHLGPQVVIHFTNWLQLEDFRNKLTEALSAHYEDEMEADRIATNGSEPTPQTP